MIHKAIDQELHHIEQVLEAFETQLVAEYHHERPNVGHILEKRAYYFGQRDTLRAVKAVLAKIDMAQSNGATQPAPAPEFELGEQLKERRQKLFR